MNKVKLFLVLVLFIFSNNVIAQEDKNSEKQYSLANSARNIATNGFADVVEVLLPAVVNISTSQKVEAKASVSIDDLFGNLPPGSIFENFRDLLENQGSRSKEVSSLGSGFIISKDGYIVTNHHVIDKADKITVNLNDSRSFQAKIIGTDKKTDLALLKINPKEDLPYVKMGDSDKSRIGEWVIAVGNPFGLGGSVSVGIISAHGRDISSGKFDDFIQTDAAINKGNSGGPLFNIKGEVIGIATAIFSPSGGNVGVGFATPTSIAQGVIKQLKSGGEVTRGWLGVSIQDVTKEMAETIGLNKPRGAFVAEVLKGGPAQTSGILATDIITRFDGKTIDKMKDLPKIVAKTPIGKKVKVHVVRQGKVKVLKVKVEKMTDKKVAQAENGNSFAPENTTSQKLLGMDLIDLTKNIRENNKIRSNVRGVLVLDVKKDSQASSKAIQKGDIILSANQIPIKSVSDLKKIVKDLKKAGKKSIFLFINREKLIKSNGFTQQRSATFAVVLPL